VQFCSAPKGKTALEDDDSLNVHFYRPKEALHAWLHHATDTKNAVTCVTQATA
jgi:hypothetical protein